MSPKELSESLGRLAEKATPGTTAANDLRLESEKEHGVVNDGWIIAEFHGPDSRANLALHIALRNNLPAIRAALDVVSAAQDGPCRHDSTTDGDSCPLCAALSAYRAATGASDEVTARVGTPSAPIPKRPTLYAVAWPFYSASMQGWGWTITAYSTREYAEKSLQSKPGSVLVTVPGEDEEARK